MSTLTKSRLNGKFRVIAEIVAVEGQCPVYSVGDEVVIENDTINLGKTREICLPFLAGIMHKYQPYQFRGGEGPTLKCPMIGPPRGYGNVFYRYRTEPLNSQMGTWREK